MTLGSLIRRPCASIPLLMSITAFVLIFAVLTTTGVTHPADEGAPARLFQILIVFQVPLIGYFAVKWLPRSPRTALVVLCLQLSAILLAVATVTWLEAR